jgi:uncharacterized OB-fold protein
MSQIHPEADFQKFLDEGRFVIQRSRSSGRFVFYPRVAEPVTGATDLEWVEPSGLGRVHATTTVRQKPPTPDYNVAVIELDEGPRLMSRVEGVPASDVKIDMRVRAKVLREQEQAVLVFVPA